MHAHSRYEGGMVPVRCEREKNMFLSRGDGFFYFDTHFKESVSSLCYHGVFRSQVLVLE